MNHIMLLFSLFIAFQVSSARPKKVLTKKTCEVRMGFFDDPHYFERDPWEEIKHSKRSRKRQAEGSSDEHRARHVSSNDSDSELSNGGFGGAARDEEIYFK